MTCAQSLRDGLKFIFSPDVIRTDWLGSKHQLTITCHSPSSCSRCYNASNHSHQSLCPQSVVEQVCRLSRTIASPHEGANVVLVAEGCPGRCSILVKLSAHLCGFTVFQPSPTPSTTSITTRLEQFKSDLVMAYTRAGTKVGSFVSLFSHSVYCSVFTVLLCGGKLQM